MSDPSLFVGHTVTFSNNSYQEMAVDSYMNLMDSYTCAAIVQGGAIPNNEYTYTYSGECGCILPYILIATSVYNTYVVLHGEFYQVEV